MGGGVRLALAGVGPHGTQRNELEGVQHGLFCVYLLHLGWMDGWMGGRMGRWMDRWKNG